MGRSGTGEGTPPPYSVLGAQDNAVRWRPGKLNRMQALRRFRMLILACLAFIVFAQWRQMPPLASRVATNRAALTVNGLSVHRLQEDLATCAALRRTPEDPPGLGRERNARYLDGHRPTLIRNASVWTGEAASGTSDADARQGKGWAWITADVLLQHGLIQRVSSQPLGAHSLPKGTLVYDARGRPMTAGIVDMHSHAGVDSLPELWGSEDTNEASADITPYVRSLDGLDPLDGQLRVIKSGGVTTSLVLPGSANNIGGEAFVIKHAVGRADGRNETSAHDMLADPDRTWRYMKMACGENPKRVYGKGGERGPISRLGESWEFRKAFERAAAVVREQDDWCDGAAARGIEAMEGYLPRELEWESLAAVLRGQVLVNTHCYTIPDLEAFVDHTNEFKFAVRAFHHAHQTFLVPEILKRTWGGRAPASALFADNMWYKAEAAIGSEYAGKILWEEGLTPVYVSDNPVLNAQHVVFEAAKAYGYGLPYHVALAAVTTAPAELLGLGKRIGKVKEGYDADIVVWDSDPLSIGATPQQVWIDGDAQFDDPIELNKTYTGTILPDESLAKTPGEPVELKEVIFTGITNILLPGYETNDLDGTGSSVNVVIQSGKISCVGECASSIDTLSAESKPRVIHLRNGYLTPSLVALGSTLGLNAIDAEDVTDNGDDGTSFSRGVDGLALDTEKLRVAYRYGVTRAISAPKFRGGGTHHGTSAGFLTGATTVLDEGAVWTEDAAVHYTLDLSVKGGGDGSSSLSAAVGALRGKLLRAVKTVANGTDADDPFSEEAFLQDVVRGKLPLVLTAHSADTIASVLRIKNEVENTLKDAASSGKLRLAIIGGAESYLVADALAAANVGVVLAPFRSYRTSWDQRRALTGAPLTNGTTVDALLDTGVKVAIGLEEDWVVRDLRLFAGIAHQNGAGRLSAREALGLVSENIGQILGFNWESSRKDGHFLVYEGNPLETGGRIKAVGGGLGIASVFE